MMMRKQRLELKHQLPYKFIERKPTYQEVESEEQESSSNVEDVQTPPPKVYRFGSERSLPAAFGNYVSPFGHFHLG